MSLEKKIEEIEGEIEGLAKVDAAAERAMLTTGWYAHCVPNSDKTPYGFNYHTHGMERSFQHKNIQIVLPIDFQVAHSLATAIINEVKKGKKFEAGVEYEGIMANGFKVKFVDAIESQRPVLRLLIPDKNGKYKGQFAAQLTMLDNQGPIKQID